MKAKRQGCYWAWNSLSEIMPVDQHQKNAETIARMLAKYYDRNQYTPFRVRPIVWNKEPITDDLPF